MQRGRQAHAGAERTRRSRVCTIECVFGCMLLAFLYLPSLLGIQEVVVISDSMTPAISKGSVCFTLPTQTVSEGDIVTYKHGAQVVCHRVSEVLADKSLVTKGDANASADTSTVLTENVLGKLWFSIPYLGFIIRFLETHKLLLIAGVLLIQPLLFLRKDTLRAFKAAFGKKVLSHA